MAKNSSRSLSKFCIVDLYCDDNRYVSIVSESWMTKQTQKNGDQFCFWPSHIPMLDKITLNKLLLAHQTPDSNWISYKAKLKASFDTLEKAWYNYENSLVDSDFVPSEAEHYGRGMRNKKVNRPFSPQRSNLKERCVERRNKSIRSSNEGSISGSTSESHTSIEMPAAPQCLQNVSCHSVSLVERQTMNDNYSNFPQGSGTDKIPYSMLPTTSNCQSEWLPRNDISYPNTQKIIRETTRGLNGVPFERSICDSPLQNVGTVTTNDYSQPNTINDGLPPISTDSNNNSAEILTVGLQPNNNFQIPISNHLQTNEILLTQQQNQFSNKDVTFPDRDSTTKCTSHLLQHSTSTDPESFQMPNSVDGNLIQRDVPHPQLNANRQEEDATALHRNAGLRQTQRQPGEVTSFSLQRAVSTPGINSIGVASTSGLQIDISNQESEVGYGGSQTQRRPLPTLQDEDNFYNRREETLVSQEILKTIRLQQKQINLLISGGYCRQEECKVLDEVLPLPTVEKYREFEGSLNQEERMEELVNVIRGLGGRTVKDAVVRAMAKIFRHIVAKEINWEGRMRGTNQKFKFADSNIKIALFRAVKSTRELRSATDEEIETCVKNWLRHAPARFKREGLNRPRRRH